MKEIHYFYVPGGGELCELPVEEARHAIKVLRLTEGDRIVIPMGADIFMMPRYRVFLRDRASTVS